MKDLLKILIQLEILKIESKIYFQRREHIKDINNGIKKDLLKFP